MHRSAVCAAAAVGSLALAGAAALWPRTATLDAGSDGDVPALHRVEPPARLDGSTVRWLRQGATAQFDHAGPFPALVALTLAARPDRAPVEVDVTANGRPLARVTLSSRLTTFTYRLEHGTMGSRLVIGLAAAPGPPAQATDRAIVALDRVSLHTGWGAGAGPQSWRLGAWIALLVGAAMLGARSAVRLAIPARAWIADSVAGLSAVVAALLVAWARFHVSHHVWWLALAAALAALTTAAVANARVAAWLDHVGREVAGRPPRTWQFLAVSALLLAILFGEILATGRMLSQADLLFGFEPWNAYRPAWYQAPGNPLLGDVPEVFHPYLVFARQHFGSGGFPFWSPAIFGGHPFFAAFQTAVLSPFTAIGLVAPIPIGTVLRPIAILLTGGLGMFLFIRRSGLGWAASMFAGVAFLLNPFSVVWLEHPVAPAAAWLPWVLWSLEGVAIRARRRDAVCLAVVTACAVVSGHPETSAKLLLVAGVFGLVRLAAGRARLRSLFLMAAGFGAGLMATAVQLVPFVEYLAASRAYLARQELRTNPFFAPIQTLITAVVPSFLGHPVPATYIPMQNRFGLPSNYCEQQVYAGVATWLLAAVGAVAGWRDARVRVLVAAAGVAALLMYGAPGVVDAFTRVPVLGVAALSRFGLVIVTAAIVLAAFGLQAVLDSGRGGAADGKAAAAAVRAEAPLWPACAAALAMAAAVAAFLAWARPYLSQMGILPATLKYSAFALAQAGLVVALLWLLRLRRVPQVVAVAVTLAVLCADLLAFGRGFHPSMPPADVFPRVPEIVAVQRDPGLFRVAGFDEAFVPNAAMAFGMQDVRGYDGMWPDRYCRLLDRGFPESLPSHRIPPGTGMSLLDLLNVKYIFGRPGLDLPPDRFAPMAAGRSGLYLNRTAYPRAFLADRTMVVPDATALDVVAHGRVDLRRTVVLSREVPAAERPDASPGDASPGDADVVAYENQRVEVAVRASRRAWLVLSDRFDRGWKAALDGREVTIHEADYALRAVSVPAGTHRLVFRYQPRSVRVGLALSAVAPLLLALCLVLIGRHRGRATPAGRQAS